MKTIILSLLTLFLLSCSSKINVVDNKTTQKNIDQNIIVNNTELWQGKQYAVALTYDDGLDVHLDHVAPIVDSLGFKVTFYVHGNSRSLYNRTDEWERLVHDGHEIGSHSIFHPCLGKSLGREWVNPEYDLDTYSVKRMENELKLSKTLFDAIDGHHERTFAYPCSDTLAGEESYVPLVKSEFTAGRLVGSRLNHIDSIDLYKIYSYSSTGHTGTDLVNLAKKAKEENAFVVFLFHGVGGGHPLNISIEEHNKLMTFLKKDEANSWIAPMKEITDHIRDIQSQL